MVKNNKTCVICGNRYTYCSSCSASKENKPRWMEMFDTENCMGVYFAVTDYKTDSTKKNSSIEKLSELDITNVTNKMCKDVFKELNIGGTTTSTISIIEEETTEVLTEVETETIKDEIEEKPEVEIIKPYRRRRYNNKED